MSYDLLLFADRLPPLIGGMEIHAKYFIEHFLSHSTYSLKAIVTKNSNGSDLFIQGNDRRDIHLLDLPQLISPSIIFFNSGRWIEEIDLIRKLFPSAKLIYRTGGNEILKAPLKRHQILSHHLRQKFWVDCLNNTIDYLITNSAYTESRLLKIGIKLPFLLCVGGVKIEIMKSTEQFQNNLPQIFCAARFAEYKNHRLLIEVLYKLKMRGYRFTASIAGEGTLENEIKSFVASCKMESDIQFLGSLSHEECSRQIAQADLYMQLSKDAIINVEGGSYVHSECMGRSILEALSAGTYVIAGRSGALPEIVNNGRGLLVDLNSPNEIADQIEHVFKSLPLKKQPTDVYSWNNIFKKYELLFEKIL